MVYNKGITGPMKLFANCLQDNSSVIVKSIGAYPDPFYYPQMVTISNVPIVNATSGLMV